MNLIAKPQPGEYAPYTIMYINLVPDDGQVLQHLRDDLDATKAFIRAFPPEKLATPCAPGEWTIKEILVHVQRYGTNFCVPRTGFCSWRYHGTGRF